MTAKDLLMGQKVPSAPCKGQVVELLSGGDEEDHYEKKAR